LELREPRSDRLRRYLGIGFALILAAVAAVLYMRMSERRGAPSCAQAYAVARTAADTALVDAQAADPEPGRLEAAYAVSCGELRRRGQLR
jgi:hypothetical protein